MSLSVSNQFQKKQVIESSKVNTNFNEIVDYVNTLEDSISAGTAIPDGSITTPKLANAAVTSDKLASAVAGSGLSGGGGTALSVNAGTGLEISSDTVRIAAAAAGSGLSGGAGSPLDVNVDGSTIEINSDTLRVKDGGITAGKIGNSLIEDNKFLFRSTSPAGSGTLSGNTSYNVTVEESLVVRVDFTYTRTNLSPNGLVQTTSSVYTSPAGTGAVSKKMSTSVSFTQQDAPTNAYQGNFSGITIWYIKLSTIV